MTDFAQTQYSVAMATKYLNSIKKDARLTQSECSALLRPVHVHLAECIKVHQIYSSFFTTCVSAVLVTIEADASGKYQLKVEPSQTDSDSATSFGQTHRTGFLSQQQPDGYVHRHAESRPAGSPERVAEHERLRFQSAYAHAYDFDGAELLVHAAAVDSSQRNITSVTNANFIADLQSDSSHQGTFTFTCTTLHLRDAN